MQFEITEDEGRKAKIPHEIFITNLVANHILWFIAALGVVRSYWQPLALVPIMSLSILVYTLWRAKRTRLQGGWFVMCHWQVSARRSRFFIGMLLLLFCMFALGWVGYTYLGMMKEAVYALVGGIGVLPVMVTVLVLIVMESDAMHQASQGRMGKQVYERYPNPQAVIIESA
jgi:hypothetical protein